MTAALYREFTLKNGGVWSALVAFVRANAPTFASKGEPLRVIVTAEERQRNQQQNRFYWGAVLKQISEQAWVEGRQFDKDAWHEYFARKYGVCDELVLPDGEIITRRKSTTQMSVGEFSTYLNQIQAYAAGELGVEFE
ncbi:recombinase [Burkholderia multivorans]|uniref:recombination protein NinB n=1 Tax=Burkholderia multivorans TaxID=87883 RepID=UPI0007520853|nr:recombination protein NinB [Burkholderia multivorans]KVV22326.1 recombinase [Burkholderia multivorans]MBU9203105.1 recombination protein NinB [Burkholderia multivorans]MCA8385344.1 recombination protein NinB [Burkholderia multivorans]